jgi:hypothetical protein
MSITRSFRTLIAIAALALAVAIPSLASGKEQEHEKEKTAAHHCGKHHARHAKSVRRTCANHRAATHDVGDDHGVDDPAAHDAGDDHGGGTDDGGHHGGGSDD